jgi:1-aminocyclopropane-1-carboxylate deaminase
MQDIQLQAITTDKVMLAPFASHGIEMDMLRLDKIHPFISGNKWFKLRFYLEEALRQNKKRVITFGGAWSNHLLATAAACQLHQLACTGIIRGEKPRVLSDTLLQSVAMGMELIFVDRSTYKTQQVPAELQTEDNCIIQQGGYGSPGVHGAATIAAYTDHSRNYTHILCAAGTGTMLAGLVRSSLPQQQVTGISVLKNNRRLEEEVKRLIPESENHFSILQEYHFGGYAKHNDELIRFMNNWYNNTGIPTDFVYTGKLCFAATDLVQRKIIPEGSRILLIHSGGLSGNASLKKGTLIF